MDLGPYASYRLPSNVATAFGATTAQELADSLGAQGSVTPETIREAEAAYMRYRQGDATAARTFLVTHAGLDEQAADEALARLATA